MLERPAPQVPPLRLPRSPCPWSYRTELQAEQGRWQSGMAMSARAVRCWVPLLVSWIDSGLSPGRIRNMLTQGLGKVRSPVAVLRWRPENALPDVRRRRVHRTP